ncbi:metallophosphoesterase [Virgibacillus halophilus]|uniref:Metallophosphoesterase n=1 Tax=Tigheibacillus halophilus TaxID=361280 RepID=A0ABU5CA90_9BACI|nr:metallophosphoesterase [Virgibacillus halophilus]
MNRRAFLKRAFGSLLTLFGIGGSAYVYAHNIETSMLHVQRETITSPKITSTFSGFKIIQFSDTHIGFQYTLDQFSKLVKRINALEPDLIVFTGDLVDNPDTYTFGNELIHLLQGLRAEYGKLWVYGNHDHGGYGTDILKKVMKQGGFQLLQNSHQAIEKNNDRILIAGIDDVILGKPDVKAALRTTNPDLFTILLAHEPDYADTAAQHPVDVQLSGHSHGGQVRMPFIGSLYTPAYAQKYIQGKHIIERNLTLFVDKGIGTTRLPYRFLCEPEIHVYTLLQG